MKLSDFDYSYPKELVAQRPLTERDRSRMMVVDRKKGSCVHSRISNLPNMLRKGDLVVLNDSRVINARLFGKRGNGEEVELLVVEPAPGERDIWRCLLKRARRVGKGERFFFGMQSTATAKGRDGPYLLMEFKRDSLDLAIKHHGVPPLPPYIEREGFEAYTEEDRERYQTVYARKAGSAAAPTAGLHLSERILEGIKAKGAGIAHVTLHVGIDTFTPVRAETIEKHEMHGERLIVTEENAFEIMSAKMEGRRVIAIGTTTTRALEAAAEFEAEGSDGFLKWDGGRVHHGSWTTNLFITPGYDFRMVDSILTNFHLPKSTLLMMVSAFSGREFMLNCYDEAIREKYRLFSYGDCMFIT